MKMGQPNVSGVPQSVVPSGQPSGSSGHSSGSFHFDTTPDGTVGAPGEVEWYQAQLTAGHHTVSVYGASSRGGTLHDPAVVVFDQNGNVVAQQDDSGASLDPTLQFNASYTGTYYIAVTDFTGGTGTYSGELI
jgi:serralysin